MPGGRRLQKASSSLWSRCVDLKNRRIGVLQLTVLLIDDATRLTFSTLGLSQHRPEPRRRWRYSGEKVAGLGSFQIIQQVIVCACSWTNWFTDSRQTRASPVSARCPVGHDVEREPNHFVLRAGASPACSSLVVGGEIGHRLEGSVLGERTVEPWPNALVG